MVHVSLRGQRRLKWAETLRKCIKPLFHRKLQPGSTHVGWLVVLGFNATLTAKVISWRSVTHYVFPGFLIPVLTLLFSHASAEVRGENTPERKVTSTGDRTHNHKVMSPTRSPLSHQGGASNPCNKIIVFTNDRLVILVHYWTELWGSTP